MSINPLPVSPNQVDSDAMRTKINELISDNSSVTVADTPPASPGEGDLWFDVDTAAMYVYVGNPTNAWVQTNSGAGSSGIVQSNATTSESGLMSSEDKTKLDGMSSGGAINRYAVTAGYLGGIGTIKQLSSLGTGITVPSGTSSVFILGAEATWSGINPDEQSLIPSFIPGVSIPRNTGSQTWGSSKYVVLYKGGETQARAYWGLPSSGAGPVDDKVYVATSGNPVVSLFLMFI